MRAYRPLVRSVARQYRGNGAEFDDLCQEGCLAMMKLMDKCTSEKNLALFLQMAVKRAVRDAARRLRWKERPADLEPYEDLAEPEDLPAVYEAPIEIELLLKQLPDARDRQLVFRLVEGATQTEAARELGLTQQGVSARLGHIRRTLAPLML
jgi:RNA polymerase sigma factor (sigma-70 family)